MTALKALVLSLLLANIGFFLWMHNIADTGGQGDAALPAPAIRLASEVPQPARGSAAGSAHQDSDRRCVSIGPFRDVAEAVRAATSLRSSGYLPRQRVTEGEVPAGVWIYVPKPQEALAADQLLARLRQTGMDDALEMPGPDDAPVISLGLFGDPRRARARFEQAQALGLKPVLADRKRSANVFWVDVDLKSTETTLDPAGLQGGGNRIMRLEVRACPAT